VERNHKVYFIEILFALQNGLNHGLSKENLRKFQIKVKFCQLFWMKFVKYIVISLLISSISTIYLIINISKDYNFNLIILLLFFVLVFYIVVEMVSMVTLGMVVIYAIALYLRMRFQQITKQFNEISAKILNSLQSLIREHNRVTVMTKDCDIYFSKVFAIFYFYTPVMINLLLCISIYGKPSIYIRSLSSIIAVFTCIGMYLLSYIPTQVSTEAHRCYNTINSINARHQIRLQTKFKVRTVIMKTGLNHNVFWFLKNSWVHLLGKSAILS
jgi:hypothetical protein